ncbi:leucyl/phenylalanyl-tRNA--protein transferase [Brevibacterium sp. 5221]|uniref:Leucyl/phenylalanyl-tRNA--protein transferase n=1 Tax=Brevibacterium rongguiense TaxID=2695267 RepID=A0A6N9H8I7_9MICO|nr:leucyl/phenylalanyl-tRNA--protein transferase [Brevibacterium rongguiense]MYM20235.1 leucyl/phenylalanyl-tRNA--protein transferase [Brevibacterium rongguiense]
MDLEDLRAVGTALEADQVLSAYRAGLFPMGIGEGGTGPIGWWAPERRGVLRPGDLHVSHSLRASARRFTATVDTAFAEVVSACADPQREGTWITPRIAAVYRALHAAGHAHSVEVWADGELAGGLYGVAFGAVFAGESMFHRRTDASKAALVELVRRLDAAAPGRWLVDAQWWTPHLGTLGVSEISGLEYLAALEDAGRDDHCQAFPTK